MLPVRLGRYSVVIPTAGGRPSLRHCINAVLAQSQPADEVIVVAAAPAARPDWLPGSVRFVTASASTSGQRNLGIRLSTTEFVLLVDDDNILGDTFAEQILAAWTAADRGVAAVAGVIANDPRLPFRQNLLYFVLGMGYNAFNGRASSLRWSGHVRSVYSPSARVAARFVHCCCTLYRRDLLCREPFDETFTGYVIGEDLDLAARLGSHGVLLHAPSAVSWAWRCPSTCPDDPETVGRLHGEVLANFRWRHRGPGLVGTTCWMIANVGQAGILGSRAIRTGSWLQLYGFLSGLGLTHRRILTGECRRWRPTSRGYNVAVPVTEAEPQNHSAQPSVFG
ncbi:glycosyltransferase family 2 protein [Nocardia takedensis]|uniref:glycosyltransferase family 2 protein n=1 Tax=Nocardia TaxID=1817 RepID=UPI0024577926|nr:glycosyltransferase family 2 protein [Nocardia abscessus]